MENLELRKSTRTSWKENSKAASKLQKIEVSGPPRLGRTLVFAVRLVSRGKDKEADLEIGDPQEQRGPELPPTGLYSLRFRPSRRGSKTEKT